MRNSESYFVSSVAIILSAVCLWVTGCGDVDALDNERVMYAASLTTHNEEDETSDIDVIYSDCDGEPEEIGKFGASVTIAANTDVPDLRVLGYTFVIFPINGKYIESNGVSPVSIYDYADVTPPALPPALSPRTITYTSPKLMSGGTLTFDIDIWTQSDKQYYVYTFLENTIGYSDGIYDQIDVNGTTVDVYYGTEAESAQFIYGYTVTLHCEDTEGNEFDIEVAPDDWAIFSNYDNC